MLRRANVALIAFTKLTLKTVQARERPPIEIVLHSAVQHSKHGQRFQLLGGRPDDFMSLVAGMASSGTEGYSDFKTAHGVFN